MHPERQEVPAPQELRQVLRALSLHGVDDQDDDEDGDQWQEADIDPEVVLLVDEGEPHDVAGHEDEHEDQVEDREPPEKPEKQVKHNTAKI